MTPFQNGIKFSRQIYKSETLEVGHSKNTIKMATKTKKAERLEQTELFISAWEAEPSLWNVISIAYKNFTAKMRSLRNLGEKFP